MTSGVVGIVSFIMLGLLLGVGGIAINRLVSPHRPHKAKSITYECGADTIGTAWVRFKISYFLYALVFLVFDVETIFFYPFAVLFKRLGVMPLVTMSIFLVILVVGLWYEWKEGALEWK